MKSADRTEFKPYPLGAHAENGEVRFSFVSKKRACGVLIYDKKSGKKLYKLPFTEEERVGNVHCKYVQVPDPGEISYQFYEEDRIVPDPYARMFDGNAVYGKERRLQDLKAVIPEAQHENEAFDWQGDKCPRIPYHDCLCYCAHVRGFTKHPSSGVAHRGTFAGMAEKIGYLKATGITTVELQPVYEFTEMPTKEERHLMLGGGNAAHAASDADLDKLVPKKCNYWGYKLGYYYAPKSAYASGEDACAEFKEMVRAFHQNGMEVILQFYFPESVKQLEITEILKFWVLEYHVDGFHLMGMDLPVDMIAAEGLLADTKLWYYYFNTDKLYAADEIPGYCNLASYNDEYLYTMRKYLKGDENMLNSVLTQMRQIPQKMGRIHYMSNYYGLTLMDMVSYDRKHNEANGEDNRDGNDFNSSWNCGEEGPTRKKKVQALRRKQIKNAMLLLLMTQSTPLIFMGDEFGNSQKGNNNPYCQDNAITWLNWNDLQKNADIYDFWLEMVNLRRKHPILHPATECRVMDYISCGYPDLSYHGESAWRPRMDSYNRHIGIMYCGKYAKSGNVVDDTFFYVAYNMYWEPKELALPKLPADMHWQLLRCTDDRECERARANAAKEVESGAADAAIKVPGRCCAVFLSVPDRTSKRKKKQDRKPDVKKV